MVKKIIVYGTPEMEKAVLDAAALSGFSAVGNGHPPVPTRRYKGRIIAERKEVIEKNISMSNGTMIFYQEKMDSVCQVARKIANKNGLPCFHLDLELYELQEAVDTMKAWAELNCVTRLFVIGSDNQQDLALCYVVKDVMSFFFNQLIMP